MRSIVVCVFLLALTVANASYGGIVQIYSNQFNSLDGLTTNPGMPEGSVSLQDGQLKLAGKIFDYHGAYASIHA